MSPTRFQFHENGAGHSLDLVRVEGTEGRSFLFGEGPDQRPIDLPPFFMATTPVTQAL